MEFEAFWKLKQAKQITEDSVWTARYLSVCPVCGLHFTHARKGKVTCSDACRVKAARIKAGRASSYKEAHKRMVETKTSTIIEHTCEMCGKEFRRDALAANVVYCSNACKQRAYRERKSNVTR